MSGKIEGKIKSSFPSANQISSTTYSWICQVSKTCFLSCTVHSLLEDRTFDLAEHNKKVFLESNTIEKKKFSIVSDTNIPAKNVSVNIYDNSVNMREVNGKNF